MRLASAALALAASALGAQQPPAAGHAGHAAHGARGAAGDSAFAALQARGAAHMGVDQWTSTHRFVPLPDGGRIELQRDAADAAGVAEIRAHMGRIATAFAAGDFTTPAAVHARAVPGTATMAARRAAIRYTVDTLPRGAAVRIRTGDAQAVRAVHEFLAFQRRDHRAGGAPAAAAATSSPASHRHR